MSPRRRPQIVAPEDRPAAETPQAPPGSAVKLPATIGVQELARRLRVSGIDVIKQLMRSGVMANLTQAVDYATAAAVAQGLGYQVEQEAPALSGDLEALYRQGVTAGTKEPAPGPPKGGAAGEAPGPAKGSGKGAAPAAGGPRPPVVTILGHVDHGKTTLLDKIRQARVAESEAGGITQRIGAYQVEVPAKEAGQGQGRPITFLDTPGHEAFTAMRARGAKVTDVAVLVVAADDGVMPQTVEAISHARAAGVPIVVAVNKIDKAGADPGRVKTQLMEHGLVIEEFGGEVVAVPVSAKTGEGIDLLLENILLVADIAELKADPERPAVGTVIEAHLDRSRGPVATVLVQQGTLRVGDPVVAGETEGRVKALTDHQGRRVKQAGPSTPAQVLGLDALPRAGDPVVAFAGPKEAQAFVEARRARQAAAPVRSGAVGAVRAAGEEAGAQGRQLALIVKADSQGSVEALRASLERLSAPGTRLRVLHAAAGSITDSDILLASASQALVLGFNTRVEPGAQALARDQGIEVRRYDIIYTLLEDVQKALAGMLEPVQREVVDGHAEVRAVFTVGRRQKIAGCYVTDGVARRGSQARVLRGGKTVGQGAVSSLKRFKDDAREVTAGLECGVGVDGFDTFAQADRLEFFHSEATPR